MVKLNAKQVQLLKKEAHHLEPVVHFGKNGLTDSFVESVDEALSHHELIKIRFIDFKSSRKELSQQIADRVKAILVTVIGNNAVVYRMQLNPDDRKYLK